MFAQSTRRPAHGSFVQGREHFTIRTADALGYTRHAIAAEVPNGEETRVIFGTRLQVAPGRYDLLLLAQATANIGDATVIIRPTPGWRVVSDQTASDGSWTSSVSLDLSRSFTFIFEQTD